MINYTALNLKKYVQENIPLRKRKGKKHSERIYSFNIHLKKDAYVQYMKKYYIVVK